MADLSLSPLLKTLLDTLNARIELKRGTAGTIDAESGVRHFRWSMTS